MADESKYAVQIIDREVVGETIRIDSSQVIRSTLTDCTLEICGDEPIQFDWKDSSVVRGSIQLLEPAASVVLLLAVLQSFGAIQSLDVAAAHLLEHNNEKLKRKMKSKFSIVAGGKADE